MQCRVGACLFINSIGASEVDPGCIESVKHTVKATRTQVREFLSFWELLRQITRWFLLTGFLFRGVVLYFGRHAAV